MNYRNILEKYITNELDEELRKQVKQDIEKQEAISDYLFDQEEVNSDEPLEYEVETGMDGTEEFTKKMNQAIRRAFVKAGVIVGTITIAIVLFLLFVLPHLVSLFYYNPGAEVDAYEDEGVASAMQTTNQMSLDMMIYTEVFMPCNPRQSVEVVANGYGSYDVSIGSFYYYEEYEEAVGKIDKNTLTLYNPSAFSQAPGNVFGWFQQTPTIETSLRDTIKEDIYDESADAYINTYMAASGAREQATEILESLQENKNYVAYVTLDQLMPYEEFMKLTEVYEDFYPRWVSVVSSELNGNEMIRSGNYGFCPSSGASSVIYWDEEIYPELWTFTNDTYEEDRDAVKKRTMDEAYMSTHFISMLSYLQDQEEFCEMMGVDSDEMQLVKEYVEENGIILQGFVIMGTKDELLRINDMEEVYAMYVEG